MQIQNLSGNQTAVESIHACKVWQHFVHPAKDFYKNPIKAEARPGTSLEGKKKWKNDPKARKGNWMQEVGSECSDDPDMHQIEHGCDTQPWESQCFSESCLFKLSKSAKIVRIFDKVGKAKS